MVGLVKMCASSQNNVVFASKPYMVDHGARWWIGLLVDLRIIHSTKFMTWTFPSKPTTSWKERGGGGFCDMDLDWGVSSCDWELEEERWTIWSGVCTWGSTRSSKQMMLRLGFVSPFDKWSSPWPRTWVRVSLDMAHWDEACLRLALWHPTILVEPNAGHPSANEEHLRMSMK